MRRAGDGSNDADAGTRDALAETSSQGALVASGCTVPGPPTGATFYVDPINGSMAGDGSSAHPWHTLAEVVAAHLIASPTYVSGGDAGQLGPPGNGPIHAGDTILLLSGSHGTVSVSGVNASFITIAAADHAVPVLAQLTVSGAVKWIFRGLKVQSAATGPGTYNRLVLIEASSPSQPTRDILFDQGTVSSADDSSSWSAAQWLSTAQFEGMTLIGRPTSASLTCVSVTRTTIRNVRFGAGIVADHTLFAENTIDDFGDDGLDFAANDLVISHNTVTNNHTLGDMNHNDAMQGQIGDPLPDGGASTYSNVVIDRNIAIRQTRPSLPVPSTGLQGIDAFDENWSNLTVTNNVVVTDAYQGISFSSVHGGTIVNNTVLSDESAPGVTTWLTVGVATHEGAATSGVVVRNNLVTTLSVGAPGVTVDHNMASANVNLLVDGGVQFNHTPGTYGDENILDPGVNAGFVMFDTATMVFDLHLLHTSPALGHGVTALAPSVDLDGTPRVPPIALGAYTAP